MAESTPWRELYRTSDSQELLAIVTSIAAMEFQLRCVDANGTPLQPEDSAQQPGPFVIEVPAEDHAALLDVLQEIISEQDEFDERLSSGGDWTFRRFVISVLAILGAVIVLMMSLMPR